MAAVENNREFILVDNNVSAIETMKKRFENVPNIEWIDFSKSIDNPIVLWYNKNIRTKRPYSSMDRAADF